MYSFPEYESPALCSAFLICVSLIGWKGMCVSMCAYVFAFPKIVSMICPMVILEGNACGLMMISGVVPCLVKGRFSGCSTIPHIPFCP